MQAITDFAAKVEANFSQVKTGIGSLDAKIVALSAAVATNPASTLSAEDQAALDTIVKESADLATAANAVVPPVVPAPPAA